MDLGDKLELLASSARYDASCASSGSNRRSEKGGLGAAAPAGVCHSWTGDGRCVSLLKLLFSNSCRNDCAYCANRVSADIPRTAFTVEELVRLTIDFYRRNYIEGLFLSSGIFADPDIVMDRLIEVARTLREREKFGGYIHLKAIPGCGERRLELAGFYADRISANIELPTASSLSRLAPQKSGREILGAMRHLHDTDEEFRRDRTRFKRVPRFAPAGQSTQLVVGASPDDDRTIIRLASALYRSYGLRRVYYSAFLPVAPDPRLPPISAPPLLREHRLYQSDWLLRCYGFKEEELLDSIDADLPMDIDPKTAWALRHPELFPIDLERADKALLMRVPGIGVTGAARIVAARRSGALREEDLSRLGIVLKRAKYFLILRGRALSRIPDPGELRLLLADRNASQDSKRSVTERRGASETGRTPKTTPQLEFAFP